MYKERGWVSWPDWLGYKGRITRKDMVPFPEARVIARKLKLKSAREWSGS